MADRKPNKFKEEKPALGLRAMTNCMAWHGMAWPGGAWQDEKRICGVPATICECVVRCPWKWVRGCLGISNNFDFTHY